MKTQLSGGLELTIYNGRGKDARSGGWEVLLNYLSHCKNVNRKKMTYKEIQQEGKIYLSVTIKSCWIADVKRKLNIPTKIARNRKNIDYILHPCPKGKIETFIKSKFTSRT